MGDKRHGILIEFTTPSNRTVHDLRFPLKHLKRRFVITFCRQKTTRSLKRLGVQWIRFGCLLIKLQGIIVIFQATFTKITTHCKPLTLLFFIRHLLRRLHRLGDDHFPSGEFFIPQSQLDNSLQIIILQQNVHTSVKSSLIPRITF